jgi:hypothetical protein
MKLTVIYTELINHPDNFPNHTISHFKERDMNISKTRTIARLVSILVMTSLMFSFFNTMANSFMLQLAAVAG